MTNAARIDGTVHDAPVFLVSYKYPPMRGARALQVERLVRYAPFPLHLFTADDDTTTADPQQPGKRITRIAVQEVSSCRRWLRKHAPNVAAHTLDFPDRRTAWVRAANDAVQRAAHAQRPGCVITLAAPQSLHLIGRSLQRRHGVPWIAFLSDPWTGNGYQRPQPLARRAASRALELRIYATADRLLFTSSAARDLALRNAPGLRRKAVIVGPGYDAALFRRQPPPQAPPFRIRYVGDFYGPRTPYPLLRAIHEILCTNPRLLDDVAFELIGKDEKQTHRHPMMSTFPEGLVRFVPPVSYDDAVKAIEDAHVLLIVDAPLPVSVFLPSKVADYLGTDRPILALTPPGPVATLIPNVGGRVADPSSIPACAAMLAQTLIELRAGGRLLSRDERARRESFSYLHVAKAYDDIVRDTVNSST